MRCGEIYHLQDVPPLQGGDPKGRYVVIVTRTEEMMLDEPLYVVACSASVTPQQIDDGRAIALSWSRQGRAGSGFRRPTWAVPMWLLKVRPSQLGQRLGYVPNDKLEHIIAGLPPDPAADLS